MTNQEIGLTVYGVIFLIQMISIISVQIVTGSLKMKSSMDKRALRIIVAIAQTTFTVMTLVELIERFNIMFPKY